METYAVLTWLPVAVRVLPTKVREALESLFALTSILGLPTGEELDLCETSRPPASRAQRRTTRPSIPPPIHQWGRVLWTASTGERHMSPRPRWGRPVDIKQLDPRLTVCPEDTCVI